MQGLTTEQFLTFYVLETCL